MSPVVFDWDGVPVGVAAADEETVRRVEASAYFDGFRDGREQGRQDAHGDWIVAAVIIAFAIIISGWVWS